MWPASATGCMHSSPLSLSLYPLPPPLPLFTHSQHTFCLESQQFFVLHRLLVLISLPFACCIFSHFFPCPLRLLPPSLPYTVCTVSVCLFVYLPGWLSVKWIICIVFGRSQRQMIKPSLAAFIHFSQFSRIFSHIFYARFARLSTDLLCPSLSLFLPRTPTWCKYLFYAWISFKYVDSGKAKAATASECNPCNSIDFHVLLLSLSLSSPSFCLCFG